MIAKTLRQLARALRERRIDFALDKIQELDHSSDLPPGLDQDLKEIVTEIINGNYTEASRNAYELARFVVESEKHTEDAKAAPPRV